MRNNGIASGLIKLIGFGLLVWLVIAEAVFYFRHPWATETEAFVRMGDVLLFKEVPYEEMRPREYYQGE